jgi:hypothetical protein
MLAGGKVIRPESVGTPVIDGIESLEPNFSSLPFRSTCVSSNVLAVKA